MTVCVAALCDNVTVIGAADRMLTSGDIQFQPNQAKVWNLTSSIAVMTAGDIAVHGEIIPQVFNFAKAKIAEDASKWVSIADVSRQYAQAYSRLRLAQIERSILGPIGLTAETFISRQKEMAPEFIEKLSVQMHRSTFPGIETIITGIDDDGVHLYCLENDTITCCDNIGFAAIGIGSWHARSEFMAMGHSKFIPATRTLLTTHRAKKRAEVAPGVGRFTDMFFVGPKPGSYNPLDRAVVDDLDSLHDAYLKEIGVADAKAEKELGDKLTARIAKAQAEKQSAMNPASEAK